MQPSNGDPKIRSNNPVWHLLAEYSVSDHGKGDVLAPVFQFKPFRELGVSPEWIRNIDRLLTSVAKEAAAPVQEGRFARTVSIRVFCQRKMIGDAITATTSTRDHAEQTMEPAPAIGQPGAIMIGGWGYFIVDGSKGCPGSPARSRPFIDLYLYKEGE